MAKPKVKVGVRCPQCGQVRLVGKRYAAGTLCKSRVCMSCCHVTHGASRTRLIRIWKAARWRCGLANTKHEAHDRYAGRGITMCPEWAQSFESFQSWAKANGYADNLQIDRIDNDRGYEPSNCRWATVLENNRNRRSSKLTVDRVRAIKDRIAMGDSVRDIAADFMVSPSMIYLIREGRTWKDVEPHAQHASLAVG